MARLLVIVTWPFWRLSNKQMEQVSLINLKWFSELFLALIEQYPDLNATLISQYAEKIKLHFNRYKYKRRQATDNDDTSTGMVRKFFFDNCYVQ